MRPQPILRPFLARSYASRSPQKPPARAPDPLLDPKVVHQPLGDGLTFVHRPPPTAPTPFSYTTAPSSPLLQPKSQPPANAMSLPPRLSKKPEPERMSDEDIALMRKLRAKLPLRWSTAALSKRFGCTQTFVMMKAPLKMAMRKLKRRGQASIEEWEQESWGEKRSILREVRQARRKFW